LKIEGSHLFKSPGEKVWNCLIDPQVLARCIPGCEKMELAGEDSYNAVLKIGIGALKGTFISHIRLQDKEPLSQYKLVVEGEGGLGFLKGEGLIRLAASGAETNVSYSGEVQIGGLIASVGQRMLQGFAKQTISRFFSSLARQTEGTSESAPTSNN